MINTILNIINSLDYIVSEPIIIIGPKKDTKQIINKLGFMFEKKGYTISKEHNLNMYFENNTVYTFTKYPKNIDYEYDVVHDIYNKYSYNDYDIDDDYYNNKSEENNDTIDNIDDDYFNI